eukprot:gene4669-3364_t
MCWSLKYLYYYYYYCYYYFDHGGPEAMYFYSLAAPLFFLLRLTHGVALTVVRGGKEWGCRWVGVEKAERFVTCITLSHPPTPPAQV